MRANWYFGDTTGTTSAADDTSYAYTSASVTSSSFDSFMVMHIVTDTIGCVDTAYLAMIVMDYPQPVVLVDSSCPRVLSTFYPDTFYVSYQWFVDGVADTNAIGATFQPLVPGNYSVSVTFADECGGTSPPLYVEPFKECCIETSDAAFIIENDTASVLIAQSGGMNTFSTDSVVLISGTFWVDTTIIWSNVPNIYLEDSAEIIILPDGDFTLDTCVLRGACGAMWNRIHLINSQSTIHLRNTRIEDAYTAIWAENNAAVTVEDSSHLNRNLQHLYFQDYQESPVNVTIRESQFTCDDFLNSPLQSAITFRCVTTINVDKITIGDSTKEEYLNTFSRYSWYGIDCASSNVDVYNSEITNEFTPDSLLVYDYAIRATSVNDHSQIQVGDSSKFAGCDIHHTTNGVRAQDSVEVWIINNKFTKMDTGIFVFESREHLKILQNNFKTVGFSVQLINNPRTESIHINDNILEVGASAHGILIAEANNQLNDLTEIKNNDITGTFRGISIFFRDSVRIDNNSITYNVAFTGSAYPIYGIGIMASHGTIVSNNHIEDTLSGSNQRVGIGFRAGSSANVCNNTVKNVENGLMFIENFLDATVELNLMDSCQKGLNLTDSAVIGFQGDSLFPSDNQWKNNSFATYTFNAFGNQSKLWVRDSINFIPDPNVAQGFGVKIDTGITTGPFAYCGDSSLIAKTGSLADRQQRLSLRLLNSPSSLNMSWLTIKCLLDFIVFSRNINTEHPNIIQFLRRAMASTTQSFRHVEDLINEAYQDNTIGTNHAILIAQAFHRNRAIQPHSDIEHYYKQVNEIYLRTWAIGVDTFTSSQLADLRHIAQLCFRDAGTSVYKARTLLSLVDSTDYEFYCSDFEKYTIHDEIEDEESFSDRVLPCVYPNPSSDEITLNYSFLKDTPCLIEIMNTSGTVLDRISSDGANYPVRILVSEYEQGLYLLRIRVEEQESLRCKLIITK